MSFHLFYIILLFSRHKFFDRTISMLFYNTNILKKINVTNNQPSHYFCYNLNSDLFCNLIFQGISNSKFQKRIFTLLNLKYLDSEKNYLNILQANAIVNKLKKSGFFSYVKVSFLRIKSKNNFVVSVHTKPILKTVKLLNLNNLKIPRNYLLTLFKSQIGYPKNLQTVSSIIKKIQLWYLIRGYKWVNICLLNENKNPSELKIRIYEGKLRKLSILCLESINVRQNGCQDLIIQELGLYKQKVLNVKQIESGITRLKNKKIIFNCNYKVIAHNNRDLEVIFTYSQYQDRETFIFSETKKISNALYQVINYNLYCILKVFFYERYKLFFNAITTDQFCSTRNNLDNNRISINYFNAAKASLIYQFIGIKSFCQIMYLNSIVFRTNHYFYLKHYINNLGNNRSNLFINIQFDIGYPKTNIHFIYPIIQSIRNISSDFRVYLYQKKHIISRLMISVLYENFINYNRLLIKHVCISQGLSLMMTHNIFNKFCVLQAITLENNLSPTFFIHKRHEWHFVKFLPTNYNNFYFFNTTIKKLLKKILKFHLKIVYTTIDTTNKLMPGTRALFEAVYFQSLVKYKSIKYIKKITLKCTKIINIPIYSNDVVFNTLLFEPEICLYPYSSNYIITNKDRLFNKINSQKVFPRHPYVSFVKTYKMNFEYHVSIKYNYSMFVFVTYKKNAYSYDLFNKHLRINRGFNINSLNYKKAILESGLGLHFNTPIRQMPPIKFEYQFGKSKINNYHVKI